MILLDDRPENRVLNGNQMILVPSFNQPEDSHWLLHSALPRILKLVTYMEMNR